MATPAKKKYKRMADWMRLLKKGEKLSRRSDFVSLLGGPPAIEPEPEAQPEPTGFIQSLLNKRKKFVPFQETGTFISNAQRRREE